MLHIPPGAGTLRDMESASARHKLLEAAKAAPRSEPEPLWARPSRPVALAPPVAAERPQTADTLARLYTQEALGVLVEVVRDPDAKDGDRLRAAEGLLDRGYGKAPQAVVTLPARAAAATRLAALSDADLLAAIAAARLRRGDTPSEKGPVDTIASAGPMVDLEDPNLPIAHSLAGVVSHGEAGLAGVVSHEEAGLEGVVSHEEAGLAAVAPTVASGRLAAILEGEWIEAEPLDEDSDDGEGGGFLAEGPVGTPAEPWA